MAVDVEISRAEVLTALAEPVRWRIVELLANEDLCVCHLVEELGLKQPLVSYHLKVLRASGLVVADRFRQWTYYRLVPTAPAHLAAELEAFATRAVDADRRRPCC